MNILSQIGTVAAVCTTGAFIPQIIKIKNQGGEDLSYAMLVFLSRRRAALAGIRFDAACPGDNLGEWSDRFLGVVALSA